MNDNPLDEWHIRRLVENWALWRDAGDWERFATVWHPDGRMSATWFEGTATEFIAASKAGFDAGVRILHFLGGTSVDVAGDRAVAQTKMTITQRATVDEAELEVVCTGRFYDFLARGEQGWGLVRRQPIYERDILRAVDPAESIKLSERDLEPYPYGYRHLGYLQTRLGLTVRLGLPELTGAAVERLYADGHSWLAGH